MERKREKREIKRKRERRRERTTYVRYEDVLNLKERERKTQPKIVRLRGREIERVEKVEVRQNSMKSKEKQKR